MPALWAIRDVYLEHAAYVPAVAAMERALAITEDVYGLQDGVTLTGLHNLANLYLLARDAPQARETATRILPRPPHPNR